MLETPSIRAQIQDFMRRGNKFLSQADETGDYSNYRKAIQEFSSAYKFALLLNARDGTEERCCFKLGAAHVSGGDTQCGIELLQTVLELGNRRMKDDEKDFNTYKGEAHFYIAVGYEKLSEPEKAIKSYTAALLEYNEQQNIKETCETYLKIASIHNARMEYSDANRNYELASKLYWKAKDFWNSLMARICQINAAYRDKTYDRNEILKLLHTCCEDYSLVESKDFKGKILCEVGLMYFLLNSLDDALYCFEQAIQLCDHTTSSCRLAVAWQHAGAILNKLGYFKESLKRHAEAACLHGILRNRNAQGQSFCNLAFAQSKLEEYDAAWEAYIHALKAFEDTGDIKGQSQCHEGLGALAFNERRANEAATHFQLALERLANEQNVGEESWNRVVQKLSDAKKMIEQGDNYQIKPPSVKAITARQTSQETDGKDIVYENGTIDVAAESKATQGQKERKLWERGRREYSDDSNRPIRHVARGISNITDSTLSYAKGQSIRSQNGRFSDSSSDSSDSSDTTTNTKRSTIKSITTDDSISNQKEVALGKRRRHRKHVRKFVQTTALPITSVTSMEGDQSPHKDSDAHGQYVNESGGSLRECYKDQLARINEASSEEDLTNVTSRSDSSSSSSSEDDPPSSNVSKSENGNAKRHADDTLPQTPNPDASSMGGEQSLNGTHLYATVQKESTPERMANSKSPKTEPKPVEGTGGDSSSQVLPEEVVLSVSDYDGGADHGVTITNDKEPTTADSLTHTQNRNHQKKNKKSKFCVIM